MNAREHITRAEQLADRSSGDSIAHALIAIAKLIEREHLPRTGCGSPEDWSGLKAEREAAGIRLADIAPHVGVSVPYLSQLERGLRNDSRGWFGLASAVVAEWEVINDDG